MKYKQTITIADIQMNIITEEAPEVMESVAGALDRRIREIFVKSQNRCPKIEAVLLCALDYCSQTKVLQDEITRLEEERGGVDIPQVLEEIETLKADNEKLTAVLTYTEDQSRTMKNGLDMANDRIRILKTELDAAEARIAELTELLKAATEAAAAQETEEIIAETVEAEAEETVCECEAEEEAKEECVEAVAEENIEEAVEVVEEVVSEEVVSEDGAPEEIAPNEQTEAVEVKEEAETAETEVHAESAKRPVAEIADNIVDSFKLDIKPLRRSNTDENQLTIDTEGEASEAPAVEKEKQKAHKRVRSMFDLITFDNV